MPWQSRRALEICAAAFERPLIRRKIAAQVGGEGGECCEGGEGGGRCMLGKGCVRIVYFVSGE